jgi:GDP-L-fucose synthase
MKTSSKIYIAGHTGLMGSAILRLLKSRGYKDFCYAEHSHVDLRDTRKTEEFLKFHKPEYVFLAAARVGGVKANKEKPAEFYDDNIQIQENVIGLSRKFNVKKLLFFASNCMYPRESPQPIKEEYLLEGKFEPTNKGFAGAKIAGVTKCQSYSEQYGCNFITVVPGNTFGPNDNFGKGAHLFGDLIRKFHQAKVSGLDKVVVWGTGTPIREAMYVDDVADACLFLMHNYDSPDIINIGAGKGYSVREIAEKIKDVVGFKGQIIQDTSKPDGMPKKLLDSSKINDLGWKAKADLETSLKTTYDWFLKNTADKKD